MSFEEAPAHASRDEGFKATVYAMNTLLIHKGIYTPSEFQSPFVEWVEKERRRKTSEPRPTEASNGSLLSSTGWMLAAGLPVSAVDSSVAGTHRVAQA